MYLVHTWVHPHPPQKSCLIAIPDSETHRVAYWLVKVAAVKVALAMPPVARTPGQRKWDRRGTLLGLSPKRTFWGFRPFDLGFWRCCPNSHKREEWYELGQDDHHSHGMSWWTMPWHEIPSVRHVWGETQSEVHSGGQELFLDLIFVGVAFRVGEVMTSCFYKCNDSASGSGLGSGSASSINGSGSASASGSGSGGQNECIGLGPTMLHSLAPFVCMYTIWELEKRHRASYAVNSKVRTPRTIQASLSPPTRL